MKFNKALAALSLTGQEPTFRHFRFVDANGLTRRMPVPKKWQYLASADELSIEVRVSSIDKAVATVLDQRKRSCWFDHSGWGFDDDAEHLGAVGPKEETDTLCMVETAPYAGLWVDHNPDVNMQAVGMMRNMGIPFGQVTSTWFPKNGNLVKVPVVTATVNGDIECHELWRKILRCSIATEGSDEIKDGCVTISSGLMWALNIQIVPSKSRKSSDVEVRITAIGM